MSLHQALHWRPALTSPRLGPEDIHLWRFSLQCSAKEMAPLRESLAADEIVRANRLLRSEDSQRFTVGRGRLRQILSRYLARKPSEIELTTLPQGKPVLAGAALSFNLSHSGTLALLAVAWKGELGVDLESIVPDLDWEPLARRFFSDREQRALLATAPGQQRAAFFALWTRKEAWLKALGSGFHRSLDTFEVSVPPAEAALLSQGGADDAPNAWRLQDLPLGPKYRGTLAYPAPQKPLFLWDLQPQSP